MRETEAPVSTCSSIQCVRPPRCMSTLIHVGYRCPYEKGKEELVYVSGSWSGSGVCLSCSSRRILTGQGFQWLHWIIKANCSNVSNLGTVEAPHEFKLAPSGGVFLPHLAYAAVSLLTCLSSCSSERDCCRVCAFSSAISRVSAISKAFLKVRFFSESSFLCMTRLLIPHTCTSRSHNIFFVSSPALYPQNSMSERTCSSMTYM